MLDFDEIENLQSVEDVTIELEEDTEDINDTEETKKNIEIVDYKKLPVKTLREIVVEKGLVQ